MKLKRSKFFLLLLVVSFILTACSQKVSLDQVNEFLNTSGGLGPDGIGNVVAVIPHDHIDGPKNETDFYAFVNWKYKARDYIKYQVSYLSCTCREASVNMWQTIYIELTLPDSGNIDDAKIKFISFDEDSTGNYTGGHWGDSNPMPLGQTYDLFKEEYISYFPQKEAKYLKSLSTIDDIDLADYQSGEGRDSFEIDTLSGASVSANNIIRIINSIIDYHGTDDHFKK